MVFLLFLPDLLVLLATRTSLFSWLTWTSCPPGLPDFPVLQLYLTLLFSCSTWLPFFKILPYLPDLSIFLLWPNLPLFLDLPVHHVLLIYLNSYFYYPCQPSSLFLKSTRPFYSPILPDIPFLTGLPDSSCSLSSRWRLVQEDKRMVLEYTHGLFIT
jgi:hypothetical protein